jgi:hypothetical protein
MNTEKLSVVLGAVMFFSMPAAAIANIVEIWTESDIAYRCKWTALTIFITALIMGLLIQTGHEPGKK